MLFYNASPSRGFPAVARLPWKHDPITARQKAHDLLCSEAELGTQLFGWLRFGAAGNRCDTSIFDGAFIALQVVPWRKYARVLCMAAPVQASQRVRGHEQVRGINT